MRLCRRPVNDIVVLDLEGKLMTGDGVAPFTKTIAAIGDNGCRKLVINLPWGELRRQRGSGGARTGAPHLRQSRWTIGARVRADAHEPFDRDDPSREHVRPLRERRRPRPSPVPSTAPGAGSGRSGPRPPAGARRPSPSSCRGLIAAHRRPDSGWIWRVISHRRRWRGGQDAAAIPTRTRHQTVIGVR